MSIELIYNNDPNSPQFGKLDISFTDGNKLQTAVLMSLFSYKRASIEETEGGPRYGYWADPKLGSKLWLLKRSKLLAETPAIAKRYIEESLQWLIDDGIAAKVIVQTELDMINISELNAQITIVKNNGEDVDFKFNNLWKALK